MKLPLTALLLTLSSTAVFAEQIRNIKEFPLTKYEKSALRAASSLAKELGQRVSPFCVNASFKPGLIPVNVQFIKTSPEDGAYCVDAHYSIIVRFDESTGKIAGMDVQDN